MYRPLRFTLSLEGKRVRFWVLSQVSRPTHWHPTA
jgi:hypothetical protein